MKTQRLLPGICLFACVAHAQNFNLVKDINTSTDGNPTHVINDYYFGVKQNVYFIHNNSNGSFTVLNGVAYFAADDGIHGTELWRSDNTAAGTYIVKDISAGSASSKIESITIIGSQLFFTANNILYKSDGTEVGTAAVPGITYQGDITTCLTPVGNTLYFFTTANFLWKTDGTQAGTSLIKDFYSEPNGARFVGQLTNVNGTLFFTNGTGDTYGSELWKTNGTSAGTVMVKDINPGPNDSRATNLTAVNGKLYFSADDGTGITLWVSDGTFTGTQPVVNNVGVSFTQTDNPPGIDNIFITPFIVMNNTLYFNAVSSSKGAELYKYDLANTAAGITLVKDIVPGVKTSNPSNLIGINNTLYFSVSDSAGNVQLWKSNGTKQGTVIVKNMGKGNPNDISDFTNANGKLLFSFYNNNRGAELWSSDGTQSGTAIINDIYAGNRSSSPTGITYFKNGISLFSASDGIKGTELWSTNGTKTGTQLVKNINNTASSGSNPDVSDAVSLNNKLYFSAYDPAYSTGLYISDGSEAGTHLIKDIDPGHSSNPYNFTIFKNKVYFSADSAGYASIYKTNGTGVGTVRVFNTGEQNKIVSRIVAATSYLYVFYYDINNENIQLWVSDGTTAGSHKIQDIGHWYGEPVALGNTLFFGGSDSAHGNELWKATSKPGSVKLVKDIYPGTIGANPDHFIEYNNKLYFDAYDTSSTTYIYASDGTASGTQRVFPGTFPIAQYAGKLFFSSYDIATGIELYASDGTANGTKLFKDISPGGKSSHPQYLTLFDSGLYFQAGDEAHGTELWKTNGTKKGTVLVKDIVSGTGGSTPYNFIVAGEKLYFRIYGNPNPYNLYESDGKAAGTKEVTDAAGLNGVTINSFIGGGNKLFINGYTYALGSELYAGSSEGFAHNINNAVADNLVKNEKFTASLLGNPVQDELRFSVNSVKEQQAQIIVTDVSGKVLVNKRESLNKASNNISYSTNSWASGIYTLNIVGEDGSVIQLKAVK